MKTNHNPPLFFEELHARPFELQVWFVVAAIAGIRTLKSVVQDLVNNANTTGLIIDILILMVFCALCLLIYFKKIPRIPLIVGVSLLVLLTFSYVQFGGVLGATEFNMMALGVLFVLAYNRKQLVVILTLYGMMILFANLDLRFNGWLTRSFFKYNSTGVDNYLTTLFTLLVIILYFKGALVIESKRISELRKKLNSQIKTIRNQKNILQEQKQFLQDVNGRLEQEIRNHSTEIDRQNRAMKDYIWLSTESLQMPMNRISACVNDLNENGILEKELKGQVAELNRVVQNLKNELMQHNRSDN